MGGFSRLRTEVRNSYEPALAHRTDLEIWKVAKLLDRRHGKSVVRQIKRGEVWVTNLLDLGLDSHVVAR